MGVLSVAIREEEPPDIPAIRTINELAFGQQQEADIVEALRRSCDDLVSLVAALDGRPVGHILFSPVEIESPQGQITGYGLGPLAVLPKYQRRGIGSQLVQSGLKVVKGLANPFVIVLGHPDYYPRFGFERASTHAIQSQWAEVPDEAFMVLVLDETAMQGLTGIARYRSEFDEST